MAQKKIQFYQLPYREMERLRQVGFDTGPAVPGRIPETV